MPADGGKPGAGVHVIEEKSGKPARPSKPAAPASRAETAAPG